MQAATMRQPHIPFHRFAIVAAAGLVAFLAIWQGYFATIQYQPCPAIAPHYIIPPNGGVAASAFGIATVALTIFYLGAIRLKQNYQYGRTGYNLVVLSLLASQSLLSFVFIRLSTCAG